MTETGRLPIGTSSRIANHTSLKTMINTVLERKSGISVNFSGATIGVSLDKLGDWTIAIGIPLKSDRFHTISSGLETLGFFQATEHSGSVYFLWTSVLTETDGERRDTEQVLAQVLVQAMNILQARPISSYIS